MVPRIFSDSRMLSGLVARSFVPIPSSAIFPFSFLSESFAFRYSTYSSFPSISITYPSLTVRVIGDLRRLVGAHSRMSLPLAVPSRGARQTSPAGRLLKEPGLFRIPVSDWAFLPFLEKEIKEPLMVLTSMKSALFISFAIPLVLFARDFQSTCIAPSSIDISNRGMLAYLHSQILVRKSLNLVWLVE